MIYRFAICDDEAAELDYLNLLVQRWGEKNGHIAVCSCFPSAETFLFQYAEQKDYDILLLDIEMGNMNGVELAKTVRADNKEVQIIFITGFSDFIAEGYDVSALHYLIKPVNEIKLMEVLDKACEKLEKKEHNIILSVDGESLRIPVDEIMYAEAFAHMVEIVTAKKKFEVNTAISEIEKLLNNSFFRCHRSYIVNLAAVERVAKTDAILDNGKTVPVSRRLYNDLNQAFIKYYREAKQ